MVQSCSHLALVHQNLKEEGLAVEKVEVVVAVAKVVAHVQMGKKGNRAVGQTIVKSSKWICFTTLSMKNLLKLAIVVMGTLKLTPTRLKIAYIFLGNATMLQTN